MDKDKSVKSDAVDNTKWWEELYSDMIENIFNWWQKL